MRVTNNMLVGAFMANLNNNLTRMEKLQTELSTGKRINRPSDDPVGIVNSLRLRSNLLETEKYDDNVYEATSWLEATDTALDHVTSVLQKARELAVRGATGSMSQQSRDAIAAEVDELIKQLVDVGNTTHGGKYIFGGFQTTTAPFAPVGTPVTSVTWSGDNGSLMREIGVGITMPINVTGDKVFNGVVNVFDTLIQLRDDLQAGNIANISNLVLADLDLGIDNMLTYRAEVGAKINRLELTKDRIDDARINLTDLLSDNEDADVAETIMKLKNQENVYRASLSAGARIIQPTLLDFLR